MNERPHITQAMINAYDEYTHLTLDRRGFMNKLTKLAGTSAAAAAILPLIEARQAAAAMVEPDDTRLKTENVTFTGATGDVSGYLAIPADASGKLPAVVVIHENRGLNPHIQDVARRIALEGFVALAVDFLSPVGGTPADEDKAREMIGQLDAAKTVQNAAAAADLLSAHAASNGNVGAVGFCWGGALVNSLAVNDPDLKAGVAYYGRQPDAGQVPNIKAKLLLHYAGQDERINAGIDAYKAALEQAGISYAIHMYDGVQHAFNNDTSEARYNKEAADLAWSRTIEFFKANLG